MSQENLKIKAVKGVAWNMIGNYANKFIQFLIALVLARLLTPGDYGLIGMLGFFMGLAATLIDGGFTNALIRFEDRNNKDFCTVFYINLGMSCLMYGVLALSAPWIAEFYNQPELVNIIRIYCLTLVIGAFGAINGIILTINLQFKESTLINTIAAIISGCIGIVFAFLGFGVWSLIYQQIIAGILRVVLLFYSVRWFPSLIFSRESFKRLFSYGSKLLLSGLISSAYANMYPLVIGKQFTPADLGYVSRAQGFNEMAAGTINGVLAGVAFPVLSKVQNDNDVLLRLYGKYIKLCAFTVFPIIFFLAGIAKPLILFLLTDKWAPSIILLQILSISFLWEGITRINLNLLYVKGRSDLILKLEIIKKSIAFSILIISVFIGKLAIFCVGISLYSCIAFYLNTIYTKRILNFGFLKQLRQIAPYLIFSLIITCEGLFFSRIISDYLVSLIVSFIVCFITYIFLCKITHQYALIEMVKLISPKIGIFGQKLTVWFNA